MSRSKITLKYLPCFTLLVTSLTAQAAIFGVDDRILISPKTQDYILSRSTAVAVLNSLIEETSNGKYKLSVDSTSDFLCQDEKFSNQPSLSYACSGFLVAPDLIVTAGHCMTNSGVVRNETGMYCESYSSWVFDYALDSKGKAITTDIPEDNHYRCKQIVYAVSDDTNDFALIQLDRPVKGRKPLSLLQTPVTGKENLKMIGHPVGLPATLSRNARVFKNDKTTQSFLTSLDAFYGNSGSAVFNQFNQVVGILISGTPAQNLVKDTKNKCERFNRCDENAQNCLLPDEVDESAATVSIGTDVQRLEPLLKIMTEFEKSREK